MEAGGTLIYKAKGGVDMNYRAREVVKGSRKRFGATREGVGVS